MCVQVCLTPGTVSKMWLLYVLANYKLWQFLIPRDDLGAVLCVMVFLSMRHERPERRPETIAFWRYLCKKEDRNEERLFTIKCTDIYWSSVIRISEGSSSTVVRRTGVDL